MFVGRGRGVTVVALALLASAAMAAPRAAKKSAPALSADAVAQLAKDLAGDEDAAAVAAAKRLGEAGDPAGVPVLMETLAMGTTPPVAAAALGGLAALADARALPVIALYAGNRNVEVRAAAVRALGAVPDARAVPVLLERLGDADVTVRAAAASALAARKDARATDRVLKLLARNDAGAAAPAGLLIGPGDLARLSGLHGQIDDAALATALGAFLKRAEVTDPARVEAVRAMAKLPGPAATKALLEYLAVVPEKDRRPSKAEAQKTLDARVEANP